MRIVNCGERTEILLDTAVESCGVDKDELWETYLDVMRERMPEDLCEIAKELKIKEDIEMVKSGEIR